MVAPLEQQQMNKQVATKADITTTEEEISEEEQAGEDATKSRILIISSATTAAAAIEVVSSEEDDCKLNSSHAAAQEDARNRKNRTSTAATPGNWLQALAAARRDRVDSSVESQRLVDKRHSIASARRPFLERSKKRRLSLRSQQPKGSTDKHVDGVSPLPAPAIKRAGPTTLATSSATSSGQTVAPKKRARAAPVASFAFMQNDSGRNEPSSSSTSPPCGTCVHNYVAEAFVTVAGRKTKGGSVTRKVTVEEVERGAPVTFIPNILPTAFADHLLRVFMEEGKRWHTGKRWLYDREIESHRVESGFRIDDPGRPGARPFSARWESAGFGDDLRHLRTTIAKAVQRARHDLRTASLPPNAQLKPPTRSELAQETVALASRGQRLNLSSAEWLVWYAQDAANQGGWRWEPNFCVANLYKDQGDFLGAHSDPVESIGPWAIVASVTFGAARHFRMKPVGKIWTGSDTSNEDEVRGRVTSYSIRLPHNSLLICWEGFQEFWRHEVPKDNGLIEHPISGPARLNFTFRKSVGSVARRRPNCACGRRAHLKPVLKETSRHRGRYFWSCSNPRVRKGEYSACDFFRWDDEVIAEAASMGAAGSRAANSSNTKAASAPAVGPPRLLRACDAVPRVAKPRRAMAKFAGRQPSARKQERSDAG